MIKILGKFTKNNNIIAWRIKDGDDQTGVEYNIAYRALYHKIFFDELLNSGYIFHDYHGDISTLDGFKISELPESTEYLSDSELNDLLDSIEVGMYDEKDILEYFKRDTNIEFVNVLESENPTVKNREEFIKFLKTSSYAMDRGIKTFITKSINSFVSKDALFTLEEIIGNSEIRALFVKMFDIYTMKTMNDLNELIKDYNIDINNRDKETTMLNLLKEFFSYGIPGLNVNILSIKYDKYPSNPFRYINNDIMNHASLEYGLRRNSDYKFFSNDFVDKDYNSLRNDDMYDTSAIINTKPVNDMKPDKISDDYSILPYGDKYLPPRVIIEVLSNTDNIKYTFIADCNEAHLYYNSVEKIKTLELFNFFTIDSVKINISRILNNGIDYIFNSVLIREYILNNVEKAIVKPKYDSTFKIMSNIGVSPYYIPMFINKLIGNGFAAYPEVENASIFNTLHYYCSDTFRNGLSQYILNKYGQDCDEDLNEKSLVEQMEIINDKVNELKESNQYLIEPAVTEGMPKISSPEWVSWQEEYYANEIGNINFVYMVLDGIQNIANLAIGKQIDKSFNNRKIFGAIYGAFEAERLINNSITCSDFLINYVNKYIDTSVVFRKRTASHDGCLKDIALLRNIMSEEAHSLVYITKVFRENGNSMLNEVNRHFGFESIVMDKSAGSKGKEIFTSLRDQLNKELFKKKLDEYNYVTGDISSLILMNIYNKADKARLEDDIYYIPFNIKLPNGEDFNCEVRLAKQYYVLVQNGTLFTVKYSTNYDFCENQFSKANVNCDYYCVNANISPWNVTPREGFKIMEYNLYLNYFKEDELKQVLPDSILDKMKQSGSKVISCLRDNFSKYEMFPSMPGLFNKAEETKRAVEGFFLYKNEVESLSNYITRTLFDIKEEKKKELAVKNTLLKSDIYYYNFKPYMQNDGVTDEFLTYYEQYESKLTNKHISEMVPRLLENDWLENINNILLIPTNGNISSEKIKFSEISFNNKIWNKKLLTSDFNTSNNVFISRGSINYCSKKKMINRLTEQDLQELCNDKVAIQIDSRNYVIKTIQGLVKVGI